MSEALQSNGLLFAVGAIFGTGAAFCGSLGDNCIRSSHFKEESRPVEKRRKPFKRPLFVFGNISSIILNPLCSMISASLVGTSVTAPLSSTHNVFNIILSYFMLGEPITRFSLIGTTILLSGALMVVLNSDKNAGLLPIAVMEANVLKLPGLIFCSILASIIIFCVSTIVYCQRSSSRSPAKMLIPFLGFAILPGACGGFSNTFMKFFLGAVRDKEWISVLFWGVFSLAGALGQIVALNIGLSELPTVRMVPVYTSSLMILGSCGGIFLFNERPSNLVGYLAGFVLLVLGVGVMTMNKGKSLEDIQSIDSTSCSVSIEGGVSPCEVVRTTKLREEKVMQLDELSNFVAAFFALRGRHQQHSLAAVNRRFASSAVAIDEDCLDSALIIEQGSREQSDSLAASSMLNTCLPEFKMSSPATSKDIKNDMTVFPSERSIIFDSLRSSHRQMTFGEVKVSPVVAKGVSSLGFASVTLPTSTGRLLSSTAASDTTYPVKLSTHALTANQGDEEEDVGTPLDQTSPTIPSSPPPSAQVVLPPPPVMPLGTPSARVPSSGKYLLPKAVSVSRIKHANVSLVSESPSRMGLSSPSTELALAEPSSRGIALMQPSTRFHKRHNSDPCVSAQGTVQIV